MSQGACEGCGEVSWLLPLHGEKGGPQRCFKCAGAWNAEYGKRRKAGRVVVKALKVFFDAGGKFSDVDRLRLKAVGLDDFSLLGSTDTVGTEVGDITSELLADTLSLCHPDRHPEERKELAKRVTQELLALKPFVFPAPKKLEVKPGDVSDVSLRKPRADLSKPSQPAYPCEDCADTVPYFYCNACKAQWEKIQAKEREAEDLKRQEKNAKQRARYLQHKQTRAYRAKPTICARCAEPFKPKRADALYCSAACRQRAYVKRDGNASNYKPAKQEEIESAITKAFASDPHNAFSADDLCDRAFPGGRIQRKDRVAVVAAAKKISQQAGKHRDWRRSSRGRGRRLVFWNRASVTSYAMARLKADYRYGRSATWRAKREAEFKADIAPGGRYHEYVVRGGVWWKNCQEDLEKFKHITASQNDGGGDLTSRHEVAVPAVTP